MTSLDKTEMAKLQTGETINCYDKEDMLYKALILSKAGIETDFDYDKIMDYWSLTVTDTTEFHEAYGDFD